jgi:molybdopterin converting factor small subunit
MRVTVKFFGLTYSVAGKREDVFILPAGATLADLKNQLHNKYSFDAIQVFYNLNGKGIPEDKMESCFLSDGDAIMIIPPISGG